jgi:hypothetical protein
MSDEKFGEAGLEQAAGYRPMVDPTLEPPAVPDYDDAMAAAEDLTRKREAETPIITRDYVQLGGDNAGDPAPENEILSLQRASRDLAKIREDEAAETQLLKDAELAREVDELRGPQTQQPEQLTEQQQQPEAVQAQPELPPDAGVDPELVAALQNPKIRAPLEQALTQAERSSPMPDRGAIAGGPPYFMEQARVKLVEEKRNGVIVVPENPGTVH